MSAVRRRSAAVAVAIGATAPEKLAACSCGAAGAVARVVAVGNGPRVLVSICAACAAAFDRGAFDVVHRLDLAWRQIASCAAMGSD